MFTRLRACVFLFVFILTVLPSISFAVPRLINYQGRLVDSGGAPVTGDRPMVFTLYDADTAGNLLWTESKTVTVDNGIFNVLLGSVTPIPDSAFSTDSVYMGVGVDGEQEMTPRQQITSVAYSYKAAGGSAPFKVFQNYTTGGGAANFIVNNNENTYPALNVENNGTGPGVHSYVTGYGEAAQFILDNPDNSSPSVYSYSSGSGASIQASNVGAGSAGDFRVNYQDNPADALKASTQGMGRAANFECYRADTTTETLRVSNAGLGHTAVIEATSTDDYADESALYVATAGGGPAIQGYTTGYGSAGLFQVDNPGSGDPAVHAYNTGSGAAIYATGTGSGPAADLRIDYAPNTADALKVSTQGMGKAANLTVYPTYNSSDAVTVMTYGTGKAGNFEISNASNSNPALYATTNGTGPAVKTNGNVEITGTNKGVKFPDGSLQKTSASTNYKGRFYLASTQSVSTPTILTLTADYDPNSNWSTNYYTIPVSGYYRVTARAMLQSIPPGGYGYVAVTNSGGATVYLMGYSSTNPTTSHTETISVDDVLLLGSGTTLSMKVYATSPATAYAGMPYTSFSVHLLSY